MSITIAIIFVKQIENIFLGGIYQVKKSAAGLGSLGSWLGERCKTEGLSLRQAATKTNLSHATIADVIKGSNPSPETIRKLAQAFSQGGDHHRRALEDKLLAYVGYRSEPLAGKEPNESMAILLDKLSEFNEPQLRIMVRFAEFLGEEV